MQISHATPDADDVPPPAVEPIAIIGMACRPPGARDARQFWDNLIQGVESIRLETLEEQARRGVPEAMLSDPSFVPAVALADDYEYFDAAFFGMSPREAELRDPQHRMFLELAYTALEDAGYDPFRYPGDIGVYAGCGDASYEWQHGRRNRKVVAGSGTLAISLSTHPDFLATFISYKLNLRGPSLTLHTACSTSLVTLHLACEALRSGECDMALSGAVSVDLPLGHGYVYVDDGIYSPDGHIRTFDAAARGTIWGNGGGMVLLKRLSDALADRDHIRALVLGNAINNDGSAKVGFTAPSERGQAAVVAQALSVADVDPRTITYVESHGTGTELGDPIEVAGLTSAYGASTEEKGWCAIGSVKPNVGHMGAAAGVISVIKTALALEHGMIPPSLNYETPNPKIDFAASPFYVNAVRSAWKTNGSARRAGVSSFGMGGTNAHVIMEEAPARQRHPLAGAGEFLLPLSARTPTALAAAAQQLAERISTPPGKQPVPLEIADVSHTLRVGRREHQHRLAVVARDLDEAAAALRTPTQWISGTAAAGRAAVSAEASHAPTRAGGRVALMFSGQGAQYAGMGRQLYQSVASFRDAVEECADILGQTGVDLRAALLTGESPDDIRRADDALRQTALAQPALFAIEYALAQVWHAWGVEPDAMIGHSIGEYVAATLAGVFDLPDALTVVAARGRLMQSMPPGSMLAVQLGDADLIARLPEDLSLAAVNGPRTCVVAGPEDAVSRFADELSREDIGSRPLRTSHAFHSAMMEPILAEFRDVVASARPKAPSRPFISNVTGDWVSPEDAADPSYWARHVREPVRFGAGLSALLGQDEWLLVECGPGRQLAGLAKLARPKGTVIVPSLPHRGDRSTDTATMTTAAARLWTAGASMDLAAVGIPGDRVSLPTYPWERKRFWISPDENAPAAYDDTTAQARGRRPMQEWFAAPAWQQLPPRGTPGPCSPRVLLFADSGPDALAEALSAAGAEVTVVQTGAGFAANADGRYTIRASAREDYEALIEQVSRDGAPPGHIIHGWTLTQPAAAGPDAAWHAQDAGFFSLLCLVQALASAQPESPIHIDVLTAGTQDVTGEDLRSPEQATVIGVAKVAPLEMPWLTMRHIDVDPAAQWRSPGPAELAELACELSEPPPASDDDAAAPGAVPDTVTVALRGGRRWRRGYTTASSAARRTTAEPAGAPPAGLRAEGVYLVTGGLGGIGVTIAEDLATRLRARLVLMTRTGMPPREDWDATLAAHGPSSRIGRAISAVRRMEKAGAQVLTLAADVTSSSELAEVKEQLTRRFGRLDGIVHAAGVPGGGMVEVKERAQAEQVMRPKIAGTLALVETFADLRPAFLVLCSSIYAVSGEFGQVDYCAANNFLDAFARSAPAPGMAVTSVNWGSWLEVGMSAEVAAPAAFRALQRGDRVSPLGHPVLTRRHTADDQSPGWCSGVVSAGSHWLLADHRIAGVPVVPGTGHLEAVRCAFEAVSSPPSPQHVVELRDVAFIEPMTVPDGATAELRVVFTPSADGLEFQAVSLLAGAQRVHAQGSAGWVLADPAPPADLAEIQERCGLARRVGEDIVISSTGLIAFGPHWGNLREVRSGEAEEIALLEATEATAADLARWPLHPAILDEATAYGRSGFDEQFLPLGYGRIRIAGPLPRRVWSYLRHRDAGTEEVRSSDIDLLDDTGAAVVSIREFTTRHVDGAQLAETLRAEPAASAGPPAANGETLTGSSTSNGIRPAEGAECFRRVVAGGFGPQVLVSVMPIAEIVASTAQFSQETLQGGLEPGALTPDAPRVAGDSYVAPRTELEERIAHAWSEVLGEQIGVTDDFFDVGGNSLIAVQLVSMVRKELGVRLPMRSIFEAPTVAGTAALIESMRGSHDPAADRPESATPAAGTIPRLRRETPSASG